VQSQQLLMKSQVFEDEVLAGAKSADHPPEEMSERQDHSRNIIGKSESITVPSHLFCGCTTFWRGTAVQQRLRKSKVYIFRRSKRREHAGTGGNRLSFSAILAMDLGGERT
jgi:hypothetical protein